MLEVNYLDVLTNEPLTDQIVDNTKHEGDLYTTEQKEFENYDLVEVPSNASGTIEVETDEEGNITNNRTVVTYYYTQRAIVEEHHRGILINDINQVQNGINMGLRLLLRSPFIVFGSVVMAFTVNVKCAIVFLVTIPILFVAVFGIMLVSIPLFESPVAAWMYSG